MSGFDDYGPTRVLAITITADGRTHLMWWPRAREVTLQTEAVWDDDLWDHLRRGRPRPRPERTLTVIGDMQMITASTMEEAWAAAQKRWAEEDAALALGDGR